MYRRAPVQVAPIVLRLRHHPKSSSQPSSNASSPETSSSASTSRSTSPELLEMERSFNSLLAGTRDRQSHPCDEEPNGQLERTTTVYRRTEASCQPAAEPTDDPSQCLQLQICHFPRIPKDIQVTRGLTKQVQAENANALHKSSDSETESRLQDIQEEPRRRIGPSRVKELAKFFTPTSDEEENSRVNNRIRCKKLFEPKKEEESEK